MVVTSTALQLACCVGGGEEGAAPAAPANTGVKPSVPKAIAPIAMSRLFIEHPPTVWVQWRGVIKNGNGPEPLTVQSIPGTSWRSHLSPRQETEPAGIGVSPRRG